MEKTYSSTDVATLCAVKQITVLKWAQKNNIDYAGVGQGKVYLFTDSDIVRFKNRPKPGRRWNKEEGPSAAPQIPLGPGFPQSGVTQ
jgi:hypothetical protein